MILIKRQNYLVRVCIIAIFSLIFRVYVVATDSWHDKLSGDTFYYHWLGWFLSHGYGFISPFIFFNDRTAGYVNVTAQSFAGSHTLVPTVLHPPVFSIFVALLDLIGLTSPGSQLISLCVLGSLNVVLIASFTKKTCGTFAGYTAAILAGFYPAMWFIDYNLMAEQLTQILITIIIVLIYGYVKRPNLKSAFVLGICCAVAALTRGELDALVIMFFGMLLVNKYVKSKIKFNLRIKSLLLFFFGFIILVAPWSIRNLVTFKYPEFISADAGNIIAISYCKQTYYGQDIGYSDFGQCVGATSLPTDESVFDHYEMTRGETYIRHHLIRTPLIMLIHVGRVLYIYNPTQQALSIEPYVLGLPTYASVSGWLSSYLVNITAIVGIFALKKKKVFQYPLLFLIGMGLFSVLITSGNIRYFDDAQVPIIILSAVGISRIFGYLKIPHENFDTNLTEDCTS